MAVTGSFATGNADEVSDVDLRVYARSGAVETVVARVPELAAACGPVVALFVADHLGIPTLTIVLYDDLVHVDFDVISVDRAAEHNQALPAVVLWERDPISAALPGRYESDVAVDARWMEARIWTWSWYIQSKVLRGELYEALDGLQYVRDQVLFRLLALGRGDRPSGGRRAEVAVGPMPTRSRGRFRSRSNGRPSWRPFAPRSTCIAGWRTRCWPSTAWTSPPRPAW